jgi:hypothetical protein
MPLNERRRLTGFGRAVFSAALKHQLLNGFQEEALTATREIGRYDSAKLLFKLFRKISPTLDGITDRSARHTRTFGSAVAFDQ